MIRKVRGVESENAWKGGGTRSDKRNGVRIGKKYKKEEGEKERDLGKHVS